jgi:hypothetical protein
MVGSKNRDHHRNYGCSLVEVVLWTTSQEHGARNVRIESETDILRGLLDVRFTSESGHSPTRSGCLLWAKSRHPLRRRMQ